MRTIFTLVLVTISGCNDLTDCPNLPDSAIPGDAAPGDSMIPREETTGDSSAQADVDPNDAYVCPRYQYYCPTTGVCSPGVAGGCGPCGVYCNTGVSNNVCFHATALGQCCVPVGNTCDSFNCPSGDVCQSAHGNGTAPFYCCSPYGASP